MADATADTKTAVDPTSNPTADAKGSDFVAPSVADAQLQIVNVIQNWKSQYRYVLTFQSLVKRVFTFSSLWSIAPTPKEPLPDIRVGIEFCVSYPKLKHLKRGAKGEPEITFRIEHETFVHSLSASPALRTDGIDQHIERLIRFKKEFFQKYPVFLENPDFFETRAKFEPPFESEDAASPTAPLDASTPATAQPSSSATAAAATTVS